MSTLDDWELTQGPGESVWRRVYEYPAERIRKIDFIRYADGAYDHTSYDHKYLWHRLPHVSSLEEAIQLVDVLRRLGE